MKTFLKKTAFQEQKSRPGLGSARLTIVFRYFQFLSEDLSFFIFREQCFLGTILFFNQRPDLLLRKYGMPSHQDKYKDKIK